MVTGTPSAEKIVAYSIPIAPPPTISSSRGLRAMSVTVSESKTPGSSKGTLAGRSGLDPVAMMTRSACSRVSAPRGAGHHGVLGFQPRLAVHQVHAAVADPLQRRLPELLADLAGPGPDAGYITSGGADRATP